MVTKSNDNYKYISGDFSIPSLVSRLAWERGWSEPESEAIYIVAPKLYSLSWLWWLCGTE